MALPSSGAIAFSNINTELGYTSTAQISLNDSAVRNLFGQASGAIDMNTGHGKSAYTNFIQAISNPYGSTENYTNGVGNVTIFNQKTDSSGNIHVTGGWRNESNGTSYAFIKKMNANGGNIWNVNINGSGTYYYENDGYGHYYYSQLNKGDLVLDSSGNVYAVTLRWDGNYVYSDVIKINSSGSVQWQYSYRYNSLVSLYGAYIDVDSSGNVYVALQTIVVKLNSSGSLVTVKSASSSIQNIIGMKALTCGGIALATTGPDGGSYTGLKVSKYNACFVNQWTSRAFNPSQYDFSQMCSNGTIQNNMNNLAYDGSNFYVLGQNNPCGYSQPAVWSFNSCGGFRWGTGVALNSNYGGLQHMHTNGISLGLDGTLYGATQYAAAYTNPAFWGLNTSNGTAAFGPVSVQCKGYHGLNGASISQGVNCHVNIGFNSNCGTYGYIFNVPKNGSKQSSGATVAISSTAPYSNLVYGNYHYYSQGGCVKITPGYTASCTRTLCGATVSSTYRVNMGTGGVISASAPSYTTTNSATVYSNITI